MLARAEHETGKWEAKRKSCLKPYGEINNMHRGRVEIEKAIIEV
jgi:hypothetical protein